MYRKTIQKLVWMSGLVVIPTILLLLAGDLFAATSPIDLGITTQYTHFVFGDANLSDGSAAAPVAYEGNVTLNNNNIGQLDSDCTPTDVALVVGGDLNYTNTGIHDGLGVVGGTVTSGGGTYNECGTTETAAVGIDFNGVEIAVLAQSAELATSPATGDADLKACGLTLTGVYSDFNVYSIPASILANPSPGFACLAVLNASCGSFNLINVSGTTVNTSDLSIVRTGGVEPSQIIFNFYEATTVTFVGGQINGTILAPMADVTMTTDSGSQPVTHNGSIIAKSLTGNVVSGAHPFGAAPDKCVPPPHTYDFGDLPNIYGTTLLANGPRHILNGTLTLGGAVDTDLDGNPTALADGDDLEELNDDDGVVTNPANWVAGLNPNGFGVTASEAGCLNGWIDWNEDGDFDEADEKIFDNVKLLAGLNSLDFIASATDYKGNKFARFRISPLDGSGGCTATINPTGELFGGEVEDYKYENPDLLAVTLRTVGADASAQSLPFTLIAMVTMLLGVSGWVAINRRKS